MDNTRAIKVIERTMTQTKERVQLDNLGYTLTMLHYDRQSKVLLCGDVCLRVIHVWQNK